jgi:DNA-directed RNA polymerase specialized sigma24 family protein
MQATANDSFEAWEKDPGGFFGKHREMLARIARRHCFYGHLNQRSFEGLIEHLYVRMLEDSVAQEIRQYSGRAAFLVFYIRIFEKQVVALSQEEDIRLLNDDPKSLIIKYQPLVNFIVSKILFSKTHSASIQNDLEQEIIRELIEKADYIRANYNPSMLFRNYIWKVINNSFLNQLKKKKWQFNFGCDENETEEPEARETACDLLMCMDDGFRQLRDIILSYNHDRARLEICLKAAFSLPSTCSELLTAAGDGESGFTKQEIENICQALNNSTKAGGYNQAQRFSIIEPLLNRSFKINTRAESHLHWTNQQVARMILKLNQNGLRCFNRETFAILVEMYYMKYCSRQAPKIEG